MILFYTINLIIISLIFYAYLFYKNAYSYFERLNIPYIKPFFIFGNVLDLVLRKKIAFQLYYEIHKKLDGHRFGGMFFFFRPVYFIRDHELMNTMATKDFSYFVDHPFNFNEENEPFVSKLLFFARGDTWREYRKNTMRVLSLNHMKLVLPLMRESCERLIPALDKLSTEEDFFPGDLGVRYIVDISNSIFLGVDDSPLENPDSEYLKFVEDSCRLNLKTLLFMQFPNFPKIFFKLFNLTVFNRTDEYAFQKLILQNLSVRNECNIKRNDFLEFFSNLKPTEWKKDNDETEMIATNAKTFLSGGYVTTTNIFSACLSELAIDQVAQDKLRKEIRDALDEDEEVTLEVLKKMIYLDMIVSETFRRRGTIFSRKCTKNYRIPGSDVVIPKGSTVIASKWALQMDKKYYEKPKEFYPEHFTEEAKLNRPNWAYSPFGIGPRKCPGDRLALLQIKLGLIYVFKNFKLEVSPKTEQPIDISNSFVPVLASTTCGLKITCQRI